MDKKLLKLRRNLVDVKILLKIDYSTISQTHVQTGLNCGVLFRLVG